MNRVTSREYSDSITPEVNYTYDNLTHAKGKLTKVTTGSVSSPFSITEYQEFDELGRVTKSQQKTDGTEPDPMEYTYNLSGAMVEQKYPSGRVVKNVLDNDGMLSIVQSKKNANAGFWNYANSFTYTAAGAVSSMQLGNGKWESTVFNSRLQPTQIALSTVPGGTDKKLNLVFDYGTTANNGNVLSQTITVPTTGAAAGFTAVQTYTYDSLNRLQQATETISGTQSWKQTFTFDRYGNRRFDEPNTTTLESGCQTAVCNPTIDPATNKLIGYTFDNAGNTTIDASGRTFVYDAENKQIEVKDSQQNSIGQYFYNGDGKRVKKYVPTTGETTIFIYDASGKMVAEYETEIAPIEQARVSYLTNDHLGSPRITTDKDGKVFSRRDFMPFGEEITSEHTEQRNINLNYGEDGVRQKFTSYERDNETGLDYAKARYYANKLGRFTSADPIAITSYRLVTPQALNLYSYVANTPLKFTDPTGKDIRFKNKEDAEKGLVYYQNGLTKDEQKYVTIQKNKNGTYSLIVDKKVAEAASTAAKKAGEISMLGNLYNAANGTDKIAVINFVTMDSKFSITHFSEDGKSSKKETSFRELSTKGTSGLAGLTLFPAESRDHKLFNGNPSDFSSESNTTQIFVATDNSEYTPTQAIYAETLAHFGELVRIGNPSGAIHDNAGTDYIEETVVEQSGVNEQNNKAPASPSVKKPQ